MAQARSKRRKPRKHPADGLPGAKGFAVWHDAMRWQRRVDRVLKPLGLTHTRFLILAALDAACREERDAVSQIRVAQRAGLEKVTTHQVMRSLDERGFVSRDVAFGGKVQYRLVVTSRGAGVLKKATRLIQAAEKAFLAGD